MKIIFLIIILGVIQSFAQDNPHGAIDFPCETCHSSADWNTIHTYSFNHDQTGFSLVGSHKGVACLSCHQSLVFSKAGQECALCHLDIHKAELGNRCERCHNERFWNDISSFRSIHNETDFPLAGVHANVDCGACHFIDQKNQFTNLPVTCSGCHLADYMATTNPSHRESGYDTDCQNCHQISGFDWKAQNFPHPSTFPLAGGHGNLQCTSCHLEGRYTGLSTECLSCHAENYNLTSNPNHIEAQFPTTCEDCHTIKNWGSANWNHDQLYFPIYSGEHRGEWNNCADCHISTGNFKQFECINCHAHRKSRMDDEHRNRRNYVYESQACYDCHPRGKADD
ncbi:MAG: hypothetical protein KDF60_16010 [Calditrichaeota bacterium]|nr:hypothetical protein [Calditrichota bacterium]